MEKTSKSLENWILRHDILNQIDVARVLEVLEAIPNQDGDHHKWKYENFNIILKNSSIWFNGNLNIGGKGALSLVIHLLGWEDEEKPETKAMAFLEEKFPEELQGELSVFIQKEEDDIIKGFRPPERKDDTLDDIRHYLFHKRGLPLSLINREIKNGSLYGTRKWNAEEKTFGEPQCVFIGPSSAEIRSVLPDGLKGCCTGSNTETSGYQVMFDEPWKPVVVQVEAAIDALSHHALFPHEFVISTNGSGRFNLQYKLSLEAYRNHFQNKWSFDADFAGDLATQRLFNAFALRKKLSQDFDVSPEKIDEFILSEKILFTPNESEHELFFNTWEPGKEEYSVTEYIKNKKGETPQAQLTLNKSKACICYKILKKCDPLIPGKFELFLSSKDIENIANEFQLIRERPMGAKDWNESWKQLDIKKRDEYEKRISQEHMKQNQVVNITDKIFVNDNVNNKKDSLVEKKDDILEMRKNHKNRFSRN